MIGECTMEQVGLSVDVNNAVVVSEEAKVAIKKIMDQHGGNLVLRLFAKPGGCCGGVQIGMALDRKVDEDDLLIDGDVFNIAIDPTSFPFVKGSSVEFVPEEGSFMINNPQLASNPGSCAAGGCGSCSYGGCC